MSGTFNTINMASRALQAFQSALDTTGNNISNVNTAGYSREAVNLTQSQSLTYYDNGSKTLGQGVSVSSISRLRDMFLQAQSLTSASSLGQTDAVLSGGSSVQSVFGEPSTTGISSALTSFFNSWSGLSSNPGSAASLQAVQSAGQTLATDISSAYASLQSVQAQTSSATQQTIQSIQSYASQIASLNDQIKVASTDSAASPNALLDQRDQAIQNLSKLVNVNTQTFSDGTIAVNVGEFDLVDKSGAHTFPSTVNPTNGTVSDGTTSYPISSGTLSGQMTSMATINSNMSQLDNIANNLRTSVNSLYKTGTNSSGTTGANFFNDSTPQTGAIDFALDPAIASNYNNIASGTSGNSGDGTLAGQIANVATTAQASLGGQSVTSYYSSMISTVANQVSYYTNQQSTQTALSTQITNQISSVSGVSTDEELSNMLQFQRSYQAVAEVLSTANTMISDLLTMYNPAA